MSPFEYLRLPRMVTGGVAQRVEQRIDLIVNIGGVDTGAGIREVLTGKWY